MNTKQVITDIANGLELLERNQYRQRTINSMMRYKESEPFSPFLNSFIEDWYENHKDIFIFSDEDDFDETDIEGTFQRHVLRYKKTGKISIWTGASEGTIFGKPEVNHKFRAWHDFIHITKGYGYDFVGESIVATIQCAQLPPSWTFEKELIMCEIVGQAQYFMQHNEFLLSQRSFTLTYLTHPNKAISNKQSHK